MDRQISGSQLSASDAPREDWLRAGVLAGFMATVVMTSVLVAAYGVARLIGDPDGGTLLRWIWALVENPVATRTTDSVVLAIGANLVMGLLIALVYARYVEPRLSGPSWWAGMRFALIPWLLSLIVFLPLASGGMMGMEIGAGPLPILGNLILHLVYGATLGLVYAQASVDWLDDTDADRDNSAGAERGAALGIVVGLIGGGVVGWLVAPMFDDLASRPLSTIGVAFIGAAIGLGIGSFAGMSRAQDATKAATPRR